MSGFVIQKAWSLRVERKWRDPEREEASMESQQSPGQASQRRIEVQVEDGEARMVVFDARYAAVDELPRSVHA